jgi:hypothetical protein
MTQRSSATVSARPVLLLLVALAVPLLAGACRFEPPGPASGQPDGTAIDTAGDTTTPIDAKVYLDAPPTAICSPTLCGAAGGSCVPETGHCRIMRNINVGATCPLNHFCDITCGGANDACKSNGVDCSLAAGCTVTCGMGGAVDESCDAGVKCPLTGPCNVTCNGGLACRHNGITCGAGTCNAHCLGADACGDFGVDCRGSSQCTVECEGTNACRNGGVICGPGTCTVECDGDAACQNLPETCPAQPTTCSFHCCGTGACMNHFPPCPGCTKDAVCD